MKKIGMHSHNKKIILYGSFLFALSVLVCLIVALQVYRGKLWFNNPSRTEFPVQGVDVSRYQGEIDWPVLENNGIQFAYIKSTEGSSFIDPYFHQNWMAALETSLLVGSYHFFSFESQGETQAQNVIDTVPIVSGTLPPVVDIELYGSFFKDPPDREPIVRELEDLLLRLESHYEVTPILYTTMEAYSLYLEDGFTDYPLWIRDIIRHPTLQDDRSWLIWQYSNHGLLAGYQGEERYIDLNVFSGSLAEMEDLLIP